jgi:hypothetical protein
MGGADGGNLRFWLISPALYARTARRRLPPGRVFFKKSPQ